MYLILVNRRRALQDMTQAQQEGIVIRAGLGYGNAITLGNDQRCFIRLFFQHQYTSWCDIRCYLSMANPHALM